MDIFKECVLCESQDQKWLKIAANEGVEDSKEEVFTFEQRIQGDIQFEAELQGGVPVKANQALLSSMTVIECVCDGMMG